MIPIVWREYRCTLSGSACKFVECEQCRNKYVYSITRSMEGQGSSLYFLDNTGAAGRARDRASAALQQLLATDCDPVPCPRCGWYQAEMVAKLRRNHKAWLYWVWVSLLFAFVICSVIGWLMFWNPNGATAATLTLCVAGTIVAGAVGVMFYHRHLRNALEPNDTAQEERLLIGQSRAESVADFSEWLSRHTPSADAPAPTPMGERVPPVDFSVFSDRLPVRTITREMTIDGIKLEKIYVFAQDRAASIDDALMVIDDPRLTITGVASSGHGCSREEWHTLPGEDEPAAVQRIAREIADRHAGKSVVALAWPGTFPTIVAAFVTETEYCIPFPATSSSTPAANTGIQCG